MKKKIIFFLVLLLVLSQTFASSLFSKIFYSGKKKYIYSSLVLTASDFENTDFFLKNTNNPYYKDLNVRIFELVHSSLWEKDGKEETDLDSLPKEIKRKGEFIACFDNEGKKNTKTIAYSIWDKQQKTFLTYYFDLIIDEPR